jgi:citrate synthase
MFGKCTPGTLGEITVPPQLVERWQRQMNTAYAGLPESEKKSDLDEADKMLAILEAVPEEYGENIHAWADLHYLLTFWKQMAKEKEQALQAAVAEEREACARFVEDLVRESVRHPDSMLSTSDLVRAIRERNVPKESRKP